MRFRLQFSSRLHFFIIIGPVHSTTRTYTLYYCSYEAQQDFRGCTANSEDPAGAYLRPLRKRPRRFTCSTFAGMCTFWTRGCTSHHPCRTYYNITYKSRIQCVLRTTIARSFHWVLLYYTWNAHARAWETPPVPPPRALPVANRHRRGCGFVRRRAAPLRWRSRRPGEAEKSTCYAWYFAEMIGCG